MWQTLPWAWGSPCSATTSYLCPASLLCSGVAQREEEGGLGLINKGLQQLLQVKFTRSCLYPTKQQLAGFLKSGGAPLCLNALHIILTWLHPLAMSEEGPHSYNLPQSFPGSSYLLFSWWRQRAEGWLQSKPVGGRRESGQVWKQEGRRHRRAMLCQTVPTVPNPACLHSHIPV